MEQPPEDSGKVHLPSSSRDKSTHQLKTTDRFCNSITKNPSRKCGALKDSFRFNRYSTYRQEKDRESNCNLCPLFLTSTASVFTDAVFLAICLLLQTRYIFAHAQMRYNLPCGRLKNGVLGNTTMGEATGYIFRVNEIVPQFHRRQFSRLRFPAVAWKSRQTKNAKRSYCQ